MPVHLTYLSSLILIPIPPEGALLRCTRRSPRPRLWREEAESEVVRFGSLRLLSLHPGTLNAVTDWAYWRHFLRLSDKGIDQKAVYYSTYMRPTLPAR